MSDTRIVPFTFISKGYCPYCNKPSLRLMTKDISSIKIEPDGCLGDITVIDFESAVVCIECKRIFDFDKKGMYISINKNNIGVINESNPLGKLGDDKI